MGRAPCCDKNGLKKGPWTPEEDQKLVDYINKHGYGTWRTVPNNAGLQRCGKSCRLRWTNYLRPDIKRGRFSLEEEETIIHLHSVLGNKWSSIATRLPGRTDNEIKNYWNTHIRKRLIRMGIDPVTHRPRFNLLDLSSIICNYSQHGNNQVNLSRLLGSQQMGINPELLRFATTLLSSQREKHSNFFNHNDGHLVQSSQIQEPFKEKVQVTFPHEALPSSITDFSSRNCDISDLLSNDEVPSHFTNEDQYVQLPSLTTYDQSSLDHHQISPKNTSNLYTYNNENMKLNSVFSTPSSSSTPLNSNSFNDGIDDEHESYSSNMLKFDIQDILDDFLV